MRIPKLRSATFWIAVFLDVIVLVSLLTVLFNQRKRTDDRGPQPAPAAKIEPAKLDAVVSHHQVSRRPYKLWFRIVDADDQKPLGLARVVIDNGNLGPELGDDSVAVAWPDGRAIVRHKFLVWEERRGDQRSQRQIYQGPWIHVSAEGYEPRKMPLSELLEEEKLVSGRFHETVVSLRRRHTDGPNLAELAGNYIFGDGFVYEHLEISLPGQYHFEWHNDVRDDEPHDYDQYESGGRCSIVDGVLRLFPEGPFWSEMLDVMRNDFVPVRWGSRRYLIPEKERLVFCSIVNQRVLPRYMRSGPFSLDDIKREKLPDGLPEVPTEWAPFLLQKPVAGSITEVLADQVAIMTAGSKDGIKSGMEFVREHPRHPFQMKVLFTETDRCCVRLSSPELGALSDSIPESKVMIMLGRPQPLAVGDRISSRS